MIESVLLVAWSLLCVRAGWTLRRRWHMWVIRGAVDRLLDEERSK